MARDRCREANGTLVLRIEDLDRDRCQPEYAEAAQEDLRSFGFAWEEGPDVGGPFGPYVQSQRMERYRSARRALAEVGPIYPSPHSRKEIETAGADRQHGEVVFPTALRQETEKPLEGAHPEEVNWRFRVPDGRRISFHDNGMGEVAFEAGKDFGDFLVWRKDGMPSYELAVVVDDSAMEITEVVRGQDLLLSTARQLLLYEALGRKAPAWFHAPLVGDESGQRLSKTVGSLALRDWLRSGRTVEAAFREAQRRLI